MNIVQEVQHVLDYSLDLEKLAKDADVPQGLGKVTIHGGRLESGNQARELRDVFRYTSPLYTTFHLLE